MRSSAVRKWTRVPQIPAPGMGARSGNVELGKTSLKEPTESRAVDLPQPWQLEQGLLCTGPWELIVGDSHGKCECLAPTGRKREGSELLDLSSNIRGGKLFNVHKVLPSQYIGTLLCLPPVRWSTLSGKPRDHGRGVQVPCRLDLCPPGRQLCDPVREAMCTETLQKERG